MEFEKIPKENAEEKFEYIENEENFYRFVEEFNIVGVRMSQPETISASYFLRLLKNGASERARGYGRMHNSENDEHSNQLTKYYLHLLEHGALWKRQDGGVICTAMPYGERELICSMFYQMIEEFEFPSTIRMEFLDHKYTYRANGDTMIVIYCGVLDEFYKPHCAERKMLEMARTHSGASQVKGQIVNSYIRDRHVSEYAKCRAKGICQLCGNPAPFYDKNKRPYLEAHHVVRLADGGNDSIDNVVGLCPNCHRKMHHLNLKEDVNALLAVASRVN